MSMYNHRPTMPDGYWDDVDNAYAKQQAKWLEGMSDDEFLSLMDRKGLPPDGAYEAHRLNSQED